ncbi:hypothetical protein A9G38_05910 [Gilliamella sp. Imp1-1]|nr:hypothetical protein A9G38_05910 [Gilliamella apicola]
MMNEEWEPIFQIELMDIINSLNIKKLHVGSSDSLIYEIMGEPELAVTRLNRKSKIFSHLYGNVNILSENNMVISINIDMHCFRKKMVVLGRINSWKLDTWLELSKIKDWRVNKFCDVVRLEGKGIVICLLPNGEVGMISLC